MPLRPSVLAWAAAGVLKNLALSPELHDELLQEDAHASLCPFSSNPDVIERTESREALRHLGRACSTDGTCTQQHDEV